MSVFLKFVHIQFLKIHTQGTVGWVCGGECVCVCVCREWVGEGATVENKGTEQANSFRPNTEDSSVKCANPQMTSHLVDTPVEQFEHEEGVGVSWRRNKGVAGGVGSENWTWAS